MPVVHVKLKVIHERAISL